MDSVLAGTLEVVREHRVGNPLLFFETVSEVYTDLESAGEVELDAFRGRFCDRANMEGFGEAGEALVRYADDNGGIAVVRGMRDEGSAVLAAEYQQAPPEAPADEGYDEDAWNAFLLEYCASWNGDNEAWDAFKAWFLHHAGEQGLGEPAAAFIEYADGEADKIAVFAQYGVTITAPEVVDPEAWNAFLAEYGPSWNGDEENWDPFKTWFLHHAGEQGFAEPAAGFVEYADGEADKIAFFTQYGVVIAAAAEEEPAAGAVDEAAAKVTFAEAAMASDAVADDQVRIVTGAFDDLLAEMPELAGLTPEQMRQLIDEVVPQHL